MTTSNNTKVKFCGLSHLEDVEAVNQLMPEYVGLVFYPKSKRLVDAERAAELRAALDERIQTVGVFVDADIDEVAGLIGSGAISVAQLHGSEDEAYISALRNRIGAKAATSRDAVTNCCPVTNAAGSTSGTPAIGDNNIQIWKAFVVRDASDIVRANASSADLVLLDGGLGGGEPFPWELLDAMERPFALAGGLTLANIDDALTLCQPYLVDVSSGIEVKGGAVKSAPATADRFASNPHKDPEAMASFIRTIRKEDSQHGNNAREEANA